MLRMIDLYLKPVHTKNFLLPDDSDLKLLLYRDLQQRSLTGPFVQQDAINLPPHSVAYDEHIELPICFCMVHPFPDFLYMDLSFAPSPLSRQV